MYLYHVTDRASALSALKNGLAPAIGENSLFSGETRKHVFSCSSGSVPYWKILLQKDTVLRIDPDLAPEITQRNAYGLYDEYIFDTSVPKEALTLVHSGVPSKECYLGLIRGYFKQLSQICVLCARYYSALTCAGIPDRLEIQGRCIQFCHMFPRTKPDKIPPDVLEGMLMELSDGHPCFTDMYLDTGRRMWEQLAYYPDDSLAGPRKAVHDMAARLLPDFKNLDTGGWTD